MCHGVPRRELHARCNRLRSTPGQHQLQACHGQGDAQVLPRSDRHWLQCDRRPSRRADGLVYPSSSSTWRPCHAAKARFCVMAFFPTRFRQPADQKARLAGIIALAAWFFCLAPTVHAQSCTADSQCRDFGRPRTYCAGNTLVTKQSVCSGTCRSVEVSRVPCPGPCAGDRCVGGSLLTPRVNPPLGGGTLVGGACARICTCKDKQLTYGVGVAKSAEQCRRRIVDCKYGCSCDPEPRCLRSGEVS